MGISLHTKSELACHVAPNHRSKLFWITRQNDLRGECLPIPRCTNACKIDNQFKSVETPNLQCQLLFTCDWCNCGRFCGTSALIDEHIRKVIGVLSGNIRLCESTSCGQGANYHLKFYNEVEVWVETIVDILNVIEIRYCLQCGRYFFRIHAFRIQAINTLFRSNLFVIEQTQRDSIAGRVR